MHEEKWFSVGLRDEMPGDQLFNWPEETARMWNERLRGLIGLTTDEFSRINRAGRFPVATYKIHIFFPDDYPISGHLFYIRKLRDNMSVFNYCDCRERRPYAELRNYRGAGYVAIRSKYILRKLAEESPLFVPIWEDLKGVDPDAQGIYLADAPYLEWMASIQPDEARLYDGFRDGLGAAIAGMRSAEQDVEARRCLESFRRIQDSNPFEVVKATFEKMIKTAPEWFEFWEAYVLYLLDRDMPDWANDVVTVGQEIYPDCLMFNRLGAWCCLNLEKWDQAERHMKRYWGVNPWDHFVMSLYAEVALKKQDYPLAARLFDDCSEHGSRGYSGILNHGMALFQTGRCEEALSVFQRLESSNYSRSTIFNNIGMALAALGRWQEAVQYCRRALESDPTYRFAWDSLGFAHLKGGQYAEAIPALLKAVELEPNYPDAWRHLLHAYDHSGLAEKLTGARKWVGNILPGEVERFERERGKDLLE